MRAVGAENLEIGRQNAGERKNLPLNQGAMNRSPCKSRAARLADQFIALIPFGRYASQMFGAPNDPSHIQIGKIRDSIFKRELLTEGELAHHIHVVCASGFGKTVFLAKIVKAHIAQGKGLLFIDLKGDIEMINRFRDFARTANREADVLMFNLSDLENSKSYNLLGSGTPTQIRDRIMTSLTWSEEFYKHQAASFLLKTLIGLSYVRDLEDREITLLDVFEIVNVKSRVYELADAVPANERFIKDAVNALCDYVSNLSNWDSLQGLRSQLESLILSDFGQLISSSKPEIDLFRAVQEGKLVFLFLDTRRFGETAKAVGRFILQDLKAVSSRIDSEVRRSDRKAFSVIIDEFADLAQEDFIAFLDRARSSRMSIVISHQEIADLKRVSPEFAARITGNTSSLYAFLQKNPESADFIAGLAGTKTVQKVTRQTERFWLFERDSGMGSIRDVEEFVVHPNVIKRLEVGECVVVKKYPYSRAHVVRVDAD